MTEKIVYTPIAARRRVFLTGTPIMNRPVELWSIIHSCAPETFPNYWKFVTRYCGGHKGQFGFDVSGATNLEELQETLRSTLMVRRLKGDVLKELPAKQRQVIEFPATGAEGVIAAERKVQAQGLKEVERLRMFAELAKASDDPEEYRNAVDKLAEGARIAFQDIAAARRDTAIAKVPYVLEHLSNVTGKVIVFAHHHDVIDQLMAALGKAAVCVTGKVSLAARQAAVDRFQTDPTCLYFVGNIKAAGVGLTLTASSHVVFAELTYTPSDIQQAEDRAHRIGQRDSVLVQHLVLEGSIDANMSRSLVRKMNVIEQALDKEIMLPDLSMPVFADDADVATTGLTRKQIATEAPTLSEFQIGYIQRGLQLLAAMDADRARDKNDMGFNRLDTEIGCSLAARGSLTPKQAVIGRKLVNKYRKQLPEEIVRWATKGEDVG